MSKRTTSKNICSIDGCERGVIARGWCGLHYKRWRAHGDPTTLLYGVNTCRVKGCDRKYVASGYCGLHYGRFLKYGDPSDRPRKRKRCSVDGCERKHNALGYCELHYGRVRRHGDPHISLYRDKRRIPVREKILSGSELITETGCRIWLRGLNGNGYGTLCVNKETMLVHRLSYECFIGDIPDGMHVLHRCDVRCCCAPPHLFLGTNEDNHNDKMNKNRQAKGDTNGKSILTEKQVLDIKRALLRNSERGCLTDLANTYGVSPNAIRGIKTGRTWAHVRL